MVTVSSCELDRRSAARMPLEVATATASASVENEPKAVTPASSAAAMTARAPAARSSGPAAAVPSDHAAASGDTTPASGSPAQSSSSSTLRVIAAARSTSARRPSASERPLLATPTRRPCTNRRLTKTSVLATFWWISLLANRVSALSVVTTSASASPAPAASASRSVSSARRSAASGSPAAARPPAVVCETLTPSPPRARCGSEPRRRRGPRDPPGRARPCRSSAFPTSARTRRRRRRPSSATART